MSPKNRGEPPWGDQLNEVDLGPWFERHGRDLPWRRTRDPWAILVSEVMLQQTQVARVLDRWPAFLERFGSPGQTADAGQAAVVEQWAGLGYNRRPRNLHRAAVTIVSEHGGSVPSDLSSLLDLPGIGAYTARAIRVFAFEQVEAVLDTNVARILARVAGRTMSRSQAQAMADAVVDSTDPWRWNQALLDIGARHCRPEPDCGSCPLSGACDWWSAGRPEPDPAVGSAAVSTGQSRFEGSDRQGRGRLVDALRNRPVGADELGRVMGWPDDHDRVRRVVDGLVVEGLVRWEDPTVEDRLLLA